MTTEQVTLWNCLAITSIWNLIFSSIALKLLWVPGVPRGVFF